MKSSPLEPQEDISNNNFLPWQKQIEEKTHEIARYAAGKIRANTQQKFLQQKEGNEPKWGRRRTPGWPGGRPRQGGAWAPWSSSPAPLRPQIFLIFEKLIIWNFYGGSRCFLTVIHTFSILLLLVSETGLQHVLHELLCVLYLHQH